MQTYLALGDSYTIGEQVPLQESFPYQLMKLLRHRGWQMVAPEIVAVTGWTTSDLLNGIDQANLLPAYDLVTLLIGVNNQYRGWDIPLYENEFTQLLQVAIQHANGLRNNVLVVSIPDWGVTPFAEGRNREQITAEIDEYNQINLRLATQQAVGYIDITPGSRRAATNAALLANDGLHPSALEYAQWALAAANYLSQNAGGSIPKALK